MSASLPPVCFARDVCDALRISRSTLDRLRRYGAFPIPEIDPPLDKRPRWSGDAVRAYIEQTQLAHAPRLRPRANRRKTHLHAVNGVVR